MEIEKQRWMPVSGSCATQSVPGGFGWGQALGSTANETWWDKWENEDHRFLTTLAHRGDGWMAGSYLPKSCTEYSSYSDAWVIYDMHLGDDVEAYVKNSFDGKGGRILDADIYSANNEWWLNVILVANYGSAFHKFWRGYNATEQWITDAINGKTDNVKKKLVAIERQPNGNFVCAMDEWKPGEAWWWGFGAKTQFVKDVCAGNAWGSTQKRLVSIKSHGPDNWTFIAIPRDGLGWHWWDSAPWTTISDDCKNQNRRVIDIQRYESSPDHFTAIVLQND